jgi:hypothetical protein
MCLALAEGVDADRKWREGKRALRLFLDDHGLGKVEIIRREEAPAHNGRGGKFCQVIRAI